MPRHDAVGGTGDGTRRGGVASVRGAVMNTTDPPGARNLPTSPTDAGAARGRQEPTGAEGNQADLRRRRGVASAI